MTATGETGVTHNDTGRSPTTDVDPAPFRDRRRVLMVAEAVTLAHLARPLSLAGCLDPSRYDIEIACDPRCAAFLEGSSWRRHSIKSIRSADFLDSLAHGRPVYDVSTLASYVDDDLRAFARARPHVVVGDFRLSLAVSARLAGIPYLTITNGYWSPAYPGALPLPSLPMTQWLPLPLAAALFRIASPVAMRVHCRALNELRRRHGMSGYGGDLRLAYTDADHVLCADAQPLISSDNLPANHTHLGPLAWSPHTTLPDWWHLLADDLPTVYVTLGSSGAPGLLESVFAALGDLPVQVVASTAGRPLPSTVPANVRVEPYLDGELAASRSRLVVCNGGSPTTQQALSAGVPVLGLAGNMDQMLNMRAVTQSGAGECLRADRATAGSIREIATTLLEAASYLVAARRVAALISKGRPVAEIFDQVVDRMLREPELRLQ